MDDIHLHRNLQDFKRQLTRIKVLILCLGLANLLIVLLAGAKANPPKKIEATGITLVDSKGTRRVLLDIDDVGPTLKFFDPDGKNRLTLRASNHGSIVQLLDRHENGRIAMVFSDQANQTSLMIADGKRRSRVVLTSDDQDEPFLALGGSAAWDEIVLKSFKTGPSIMLQEKSAPRAYLAVQDGDPGLVFLDTEKTKRIVISSTEKGKYTSFVTCDAKGAPQLFLGAVPLGHGLFLMRGLDKIGARFELSEKGPRFSLSSPEGKVLFEKP